MKIGFDGRFIRRGKTGNGVFSLHLLNGLSRVDKQNKYTVYLLEDSAFVAQPNFELKRMPVWHANSHARFLLTFPTELLTHRVDVFHALYTVPLVANSRVVLSLVEFGWFTNPEDFPASKLFLAQLRILTRLSVKRAHRIITPTETGRSLVIDYFGLPKEKVTAIPFGFNEEFLELATPEQLASVKKEFGIRGDYLLNVGDLHPRKNLTLLIDSFARLQQNGKHPHQLVLVGKDHWHAHEIKQKAAASAVRDRIVFTGYLPNDKLRALFQGASLFVFPSLDEGFGLPLHEAMASGTPVVTSRLPTLQEVAQDAALYFDPKDSDELVSVLTQALDNDQLRRDLVARGRNCIRQFTWQASCRKLLQVYEEVAAG